MLTRLSDLSGHLVHLILLVHVDLEAQMNQVDPETKGEHKNTPKYLHMQYA